MDKQSRWYLASFLLAIGLMFAFITCIERTEAAYKFAVIGLTFVAAANVVKPE